MRYDVGRFRRPMRRSTEGQMMSLISLGDGSTLTLDFTTGQLDPRLTFTRAANTATVINSSGLVQTVNADVPRFDHDPTTLAPRGLLIEGTATNLINWSETFDTTGGATNWNWSALNVTRGTVTTTNPTGASATVIKIEETTANGIHAPLIVPAVLASTTYTFSVWAKAVERTFVQLFENGGSGANSMVNLSTGAIVSESTAGITTVTQFGTTGWYRISMRLTTTVGQTNANCQLRLSTNGTTTSYAGTTGSGIYIWGAQLEAGSGASSYIPTTTSSATRNADECSMTGSNFSSWFTNSAEGSFYAKYSMNNPAAFFGAGVDRYAFEVSNSAGTSRVFTNASYRVSTAGNAGRFPRVFDLGTIDLAPSFVATAAQNTALAWGYKTNDNHLAAVGVTATDNSGTLQTGLDRIHIGASRSFSATTFLNGCITQLKYWPTRLPDAQLQALTT